MTIEQLQNGNRVRGEIDRVTSELSQVAMMLDETNEDTVRTRVKGMNFEIPKAVFKGELIKLKNSLEAQLTDLENEFNGL